MSKDFMDSEHYSAIKERMEKAISTRYGGDIVEYARALVSYDGALKGQTGLGAVLVHALCDKISVNDTGENE